MKSNLHTHTIWCDGRDSAERMVCAAIEKGFHRLGFSSHAMIPGHEMSWTLSVRTLPDYVAEIRALAKSFAPRIEILCGVEADYIPGGSNPDRATINFQPSSFHVDYIIGSVHTVKAIDGALVCVDDTPEALAAGLRDHFGGSAERFVRTYFVQQREMIEKFDFDIVGHPDLVRKFMLDVSHAESYSRKKVLEPFGYTTVLEEQSWYREELEATAEVLSKSGKMTEVNTGAIARGWMNDAYPSPTFRKILREKRVPFVLSSDAHSTEALDGSFDRFASAEDFSSALAQLHPFVVK